MSPEKDPATSTSAAGSEASAKAESLANEEIQESSLDHGSKLARRVRRKCDFRLVPILGALYLTAFLDRTNIANAKIVGLVKELNLPPNGYNMALWMFFLSFVVLEVPSNLLLGWTKMPPHVWLGSMMVILGITTMCQGFVQNGASLYTCRFLMGIFEGGLSPGISHCAANAEACFAHTTLAAALLMGQYYRKHDFGLRYAFLAYAISFMNGIQGYSAWRWIQDKKPHSEHTPSFQKYLYQEGSSQIIDIGSDRTHRIFILEGLLSTAVSFVAFFVVPGFPQEAKFLNEEEKGYLVAAVEEERGKEKVTFKDIQWLKVMTNWKMWLSTLVYFCADFGAGATASFSPTILNQLGWKSQQANLHAIPIWLVGAVLSLTCAVIAGKTKWKLPFILLGGSMSLIGWSLQLAQVSWGGRYFGLFFIAAGSFIQMPILVAWLNNNLRNRPQKAVAAAIQLGFGNSCNFVSSNVFITKEAPKYPTAFKTGVAFCCVGLVAALANEYFLWAENKRIQARVDAGQVCDDEYESNGVLFQNTL
ncbi:MAG: hypothetical protein M1818_004308 [Claussenomyces sp. TS43310]|nr:MAG: hypothetical protein M1818_004308 [Claussenomyces sp. TS43310]